jgi:hypothetical protein
VRANDINKVDIVQTERNVDRTKVKHVLMECFPNHKFITVSMSKIVFKLKNDVLLSVCG